MNYIISSGSNSIGTKINDLETLVVLDGGVTNSATVSSGGTMTVSSGGRANITFVEGGLFTVSEGGVASQTKLDGASERSALMEIMAGGSADVVLVDANSELNILSGGKATEIVWTPCIGHVSVDDDADAEFFSSYSGVYYGTGDELLSNAETMSGVTVSNGYEMYVMSNGFATNTTIQAGRLDIRDGGRVEETTARLTQIIVSSGATADSTTLIGGDMYVSSGATATSASISNAARLFILSGGVANFVSAGNATINLSSGGMVSGVTLRENGSLYVMSEAVLTGRMIFDEASDVYFDLGIVVDFNLSKLTTGSLPRISNFSVIHDWNNADYRITVSDTQSNGTYTLANEVAQFDNVISVYDTSGTLLETLSVGESKDIGGTEYTLKLSGGTLNLQKGKEEAPPERPAGADEGANGWLYNSKTYDLNTAVTEGEVLELKAGVKEIRLDLDPLIEFEENETVFHNFVGKDDEYDYLKINLEKGANLSLSLIATDATKFTIIQLNEGSVKKGVQTYKEKSVQSTTLKKTKATGMYYTAQTKAILLDAGVYYVSMQSTNAKKGGSAFYTVGIDRDNSVFYSDGDNSDDWTTVKEEGLSGAVGSVGKLDADTESVIADEWVGFGDAIDYKEFTIDSAAKLSFTIEASDTVKFTIWKLNQKTSSKKTTWSLSSLQSVKLSKVNDEGVFTETTASLLLDAGSYYISVESPKAAKGASAYYSVALDKAGTVFFTNSNDQMNNWIYDKKEKNLNPDLGSFSLTGINASTGEILFDDELVHEDMNGNVWHNFVGYQDETDYAVITLSSAATVAFRVTSTDAVKFEIHSLTPKEKKGVIVSYTQKTLQTTKLSKPAISGLYEAETKTLSLAAGTYYVSMTSTNASKGGAAYYLVELDTARCKNLPAAQAPQQDALSAAALPNGDAFAGQDDLSFGQYAETSVAGAASGSVSNWMDDRSVPQGFAALA